jgi:branched-chain amino acid transport system substrate-binding protein
MNKQTRTIVWVVIVIIILVGLIWWGKTKGPTISGPIKIGYIGPLTGEAASVGEPGVAGAELAITEINDAGGALGATLQLIAEDDQCTNKAVEAMNKLINIDKVVAITGPDCSAAGGPSLPIAQQAGVPVIIRWASAPNLTKIGNYIFRVYPSDAFQGEFAAEFIFNKLNKKKAAVLYVKNDWGQGLNDVFTEKFKSLDGQIVFDEGVTQEEKDFRALITKMKTSNPDVIYMPLYPAGGIAAIKQIKEATINIPMIGGDAYDTDEVIKTDIAEGVFYTVAVINNPEAFQKKITEVTGKKGDKITAPMAYDAVKIIAEAIKKTGKVDKKAIRDALTQTSYQGISNPLIEFDQNGDLKSAQFEVKVIKDEKSEKYQQ